MLAAGVAVLSASHRLAEHTYFLDVMVSLGFRYLECIRWASDYQTVTRRFFGASLAFESTLELSHGPDTELAITGYHIKSTFHCTSQSDQEMVCCCREE